MFSCQALINLNAFKHNIQTAKRIAPKAKLLGMLKANAYGHGIKPLAPMFDMLDYIGVARMDEANAMLALTPTPPLVVMSGFQTLADLTFLGEHAIETVVHHHTQLELLTHATLLRPINVWLKVDTGMHRLGIAPSAVTSYLTALEASPNVGQITLLTHLAQANEPGHPKTSRQLKRFLHAHQHLPHSFSDSIGNSAALLTDQNTHADIVRPGLMLYGISPIFGKTAADFNLKPVMTLTASVIDIKTVSKGESIGYGGRWQAKTDTRIAVVAIGYGDGYPHHTPCHTPVLVNQQPAEVIGQVSMDMITVDISRCDSVMIGDPVTLWGEGLPIEHVAEAMGVSPYALVAGISNRVKRMVIDRTPAIENAKLTP